MASLAKEGGRETGNESLLGGDATRPVLCSLRQRAQQRAQSADGVAGHGDALVRARASMDHFRECARGKLGEGGGGCRAFPVRSAAPWPAPPPKAPPHSGLRNGSLLRAFLNTSTVHKTFTGGYPQTLIHGSIRTGHPADTPTRPHGSRPSAETGPAGPSRRHLSAGLQPHRHGRRPTRMIPTAHPTRTAQRRRCIGTRPSPARRQAARADKRPVRTSGWRGRTPGPPRAGVAGMRRRGRARSA